MSINVELSPVENEEEALFLMLHHLKLAASYFEATPDPILLGDLPWGRLLPAYTAWIKAMSKLYPDED